MVHDNLLNGIDRVSVHAVPPNHLQEVRPYTDCLNDVQPPIRLLSISTSAPLSSGRLSISTGLRNWHNYVGLFGKPPFSFRCPILLKLVDLRLAVTPVYVLLGEPLLARSGAVGYDEAYHASSALLVGALDGADHRLAVGTRSQSYLYVRSRESM